MSHATHNDDPNLPDRLSAALQAALREAAPADPTPSLELRAALASRLDALASPSHSSAIPSSNEVLPMTKSTNSTWLRVAATLVASGCAAALAISILLPKNAEKQPVSLIVDDTKSMQDKAGWTTYPPVSLPSNSAATEKNAEAWNKTLKSKTENEFTITGSHTSSKNGDQSGQASAAPGINFNNPPQNQQSASRSGLSGGGNQQPNDAGRGYSVNGNIAGEMSRFGTKQKNDGSQTSNGAQPAGGGVALSAPTPADPMASNPQNRYSYERGANNPQQQPAIGDKVTGKPASSATPLASPANKANDNRYAIVDELNSAAAKLPLEVERQNQLANDVAKAKALLSKLGRDPEPGQKSPNAKPSSELAPTGATPLPAINNPTPQPNLAFGAVPTPDSGKGEYYFQERGEQEKLSRLHEHEWRDNANGEQYEQRVENIFAGVRAEPLSTFSIDVDTASYTNCRRFLDGRQLPPTAAVRVEEFINYFRYDYPQPTNKDPFSVNLEMADCPWTPNHKLLRVGLKGKEIDRRERPESNLVFLVDVSGSMSSEDKLPLLREALHRWVNELSANDRVTIVTYAGDAGLRLPTTRGDQKDKLHAAIETLQSGGSTHGSAGIKLAYEQATKNFLENGGVNRVLWATDGDLNVGTTSDDELVELITKQAKTGVFLTVLGVGTGNLKDAKLEKMADKGNGIYAYLDSIKEARKVLIEQMSGTTITIAKDVKIQIEFNPAEIAGYRLIGYENRMLATEDFANDKKDAGEIGAGHTVTALYEIIPVGADDNVGAKSAGEPLKYQAATATAGSSTAEVKLSDAAKTGELLTVKLRFKQPDGHKSELREFPLKERGGKFTAASKDFQFAGCVAQLAMILRDSQYRGTMTTAAIAEIAAATRGEDKDGSRQEFVELVKRVQELGK